MVNFFINGKLSLNGVFTMPSRAILRVDNGKTKLPKDLGVVISLNEFKHISDRNSIRYSMYNAGTIDHLKKINNYDNIVGDSRYISYIIDKDKVILSKTRKINTIILKYWSLKDLENGANKKR